MEFEKLKKIIAEVLNVDEEEITMETTFVDDLGADSLDVFQIIMGLEEEFDIEIPNEEAEKIVTVGDAVEQLINITFKHTGCRNEIFSMCDSLFTLLIRKEERFFGNGSGG